MYVCLFVYNSETKGAIVSKFSEKNLGRGLRNRPAGRLGIAMGTGQAIGAHTGAGGQCADAIETGVGADGPARILHMGTEAGALDGLKAERGCLHNARLGGQDRMASAI